MKNKIYRFKTVDSTNAEAIRRAKAGEPEGAVFVADRQTAGRGRLGRGWESPAGKNIYASFLLRPKVPPPDAVPMTQRVAEVVIETLTPLLPSPAGGRGVEIKLPNDILLNGKKVCGILCEMGSEEGKTQWVVCGIGINVNADREDFSSEIRETATSLKIEFGMEFDREEILEDVIQKIFEWYERFKLAN